MEKTLECVYGLNSLRVQELSQRRVDHDTKEKRNHIFGALCTLPSPLNTTIRLVFTAVLQEGGKPGLIILSGNGSSPAEETTP